MTLPATGASIDDERWMDEAISLAREAACRGEVPVGAVVVKDGTDRYLAEPRRIACERDRLAHPALVLGARERSGPAHAPPAPITASASISTRISGEISFDTSTIVHAGRIAPNASPCARTTIASARAT